MGFGGRIYDTASFRSELAILEFIFFFNIFIFQIQFQFDRLLPEIIVHNLKGSTSNFTVKRRNANSLPPKTLFTVIQGDILTVYEKDNYILFEYIQYLMNNILLPEVSAILVRSNNQDFL